jgi:hypothetical protein
LTSSIVTMQTISTNYISYSTHNDPHIEALTYNFKNSSIFQNKWSQDLKENKIQRD